MKKPKAFLYFLWVSIMAFCLTDIEVSYGQVPALHWVKVFGVDLVETDIISKADRFGNIYTAGNTGESNEGGDSDFDPSPTRCSKNPKNGDKRIPDDYQPPLLRINKISLNKLQLRYIDFHFKSRDTGGIQPERDINSKKTL